MPALSWNLAVLGVASVLFVAARMALAEPAALPSKQPLVVLKISSHELDVGDPLLVRVTLVNGTLRPISLYTKYSAQTGLVQFRICANREWKDIQAYGQGRASPRGAASELAPGESRATIESISFVGDTPAISEPGEYQLKAIVKCPPIEYSSSPVSIVVKTSPAQKTAFLKEHASGLGERLRGGPTSVPYQFTLAELNEQPDSLLKRQLIRDHTFYQWAAEANGSVEGDEWRKLQELVAKLDEVNRDRFNQSIAVVHRKNRKFAEALAVLDAMSDPTPAAIWLREEMRRAAVAAP